MTQVTDTAVVFDTTTEHGDRVLLTLDRPAEALLLTLADAMTGEGVKGWFIPAQGCLLAEVLAASTPDLSDLDDPDLVLEGADGIRVAIGACPHDPTLIGLRLIDTQHEVEVTVWLSRAAAAHLGVRMFTESEPRLTNRDRVALASLGYDPDNNSVLDIAPLVTTIYGPTVHH